MHVHTEAINYIIEKKRFKSYLEIGVNRRESNFDQIKCQFKIGVDPNPAAQANFLGTSDEFFGSWWSLSFNPNEINDRNTTFDIVFIDGLHHCDQVKCDLANTIKSLNKGGIIVIHDTDPKEESYTCVPRNGLRGRWNGDVYRIITYLNQYGLMWKTLDYEANGVTICKVIAPNAYYQKMEPFKDFQDFQKRRELLNLCTKQEFEAWI